MKSKLITAALVSLLACASLPALSQTEVGGVPVLTPIHTTTNEDSPEVLYPPIEEALFEEVPVVEETIIRRSQTITPVLPVDRYTPMEVTTPVEMTFPLEESPVDVMPMEKTELYTPMKETTMEPLAPVEMVNHPVDVTNLKPFSPEANYLSRAGYLRAETYAATGVWMDRAEAVAAADSQMESATR